MFQLTPESMQYAEHLFSLLEREWTDGEGMNRPAYMEGENRAIQVFLKEAEQIGLTVHKDAVGNIFMVLPGKRPELGAILAGSHLDSVVNGGRYDGPAGVVAAMVVAKTLKSSGITPEHDFVVGIYRNEESPAFKQVSVGAKIALGQLDPAGLMDRAHTITGKPFRHHLEECHLCPSYLTNFFTMHGALIPIRSIAAQVELHIEQEGELRDKGFGVGIVTNIRGNRRYPNIRIKGQTGHSGAKSFDGRQDAGIAVSSLVTKMYEAAHALHSNGNDVVFTPPFIQAGSRDRLTHIPDLAELALEYRSTDERVLHELTKRIERISARLREEHNGIQIDLGNSVYSAPANMSPEIIRYLQQSAEAQEIPHMLMPSGAGHDTAAFATAGIPSAMIFVAQESGASHCKEEDMGRNPGQPFAMDGDYAQAIRVMGGVVTSSPVLQRAPTTPFSQAFVNLHAAFIS